MTSSLLNHAVFGTDIALRVNGVDYDLTVEPRVTLLDALREQLGLGVPRRAAIRGSAARARSMWMGGGCWPV